MQPEAWITWRPLDDLPVPLSFSALRDDEEGFRILLEPPAGHPRSDELLRVRFAKVMAYRNIDEGYRLRESQTSGEPSPLWRVEHSEFLAWFHHSSRDIYRDWKIVHYAIATDDDIIDVLSPSEPIVEWFESYSSA